MAANDALTDHLLAGRYRLQQRRGTGAHGVVLDAIDEETPRLVAVKILLPHFVADAASEARFRLEAQAAAALSHPNLNAVFDSGIEEIEGARVPFLVLEHLGGGSMRDMLDRGRLLTPSQALLIGLDACRGLDYMHRRGVMHLGLTPANFAFGEDRSARILDVCLSRMFAEQTWAEPSAAGIEAARYSSPEQAIGGTVEDGTLGTASDIYSLCLIMIESVTGQVPFAADSTVATLNARVDKLMPVSADFGPLAAVLERAGRARAADRYTAAELGRALVQAAEKFPRPAPLPIVTTSLFGDSSGAMRRPTDPTGPAGRPAPPTVETPAVVPAPVTEPESDDVAVVAAVDPAPVVEPPAPDTMLLPQILAEPGPVSPVFALPPIGPPSVVVPPPPITTTSPPPLLITLAEDAEPAPHLVSAPAAPGLMFVDALPDHSTLVDTAAMDVGAVAVDDGPPQPPPPDSTGETRLYDYETAEPRRRKGWIFAVLLLVLALAAGGFVAFRLLRDTSHTVPTLVGMSAAVAQNQIAEDNWTVVTTTERSDAQPQGNVIRTEPVGGTMLKEGKTITLVVSDGPTLSTLPDVTGQTLDAAKATLAAAKLALTVGQQVYSEDVPADTVISWSVPAQPGLTPGMSVMQQTDIAVVLSKGPAPRTVPKLVGLDEAAATAALAALKLTVTRDPNDTFSPTVPAGLVADQSVAAGTQVPRNSSVTIAISKGPDYVAMPSLQGLDFAGIQAALTAAGLTVGKVTGPNTGILYQASIAGAPALPGQMYIRNTAVDLFYL